MSAVLGTEVLNELRRIADSRAASLVKGLSKKETKYLEQAVRTGGVLAVATSRHRSTQILGRLGADAVGAKGTAIKPDGERLLVAQRLFSRYANEISAALLLAALPQTYASEHGSEVLFAGQLSKDITPRIRGTAQFLMVITQPSNTAAAAAALWKPSGRFPPRALLVPPPWRMCAALRVYHELIRRRMAPVAKRNKRRWGALLNQEDLLGTLLTFTITVFEVLEQFGQTWTADEQDAYLHLWDLVGAHLGIGTPPVIDELKRRGLTGPWRGRNGWTGLRPPTVAVTRSLLEEIRAREWVSRKPGGVREKEWKTGSAGRQLVRVLLDELNAEMPTRFQSWPLAVIRQLAPPPVQDRLQLGAPGFLMAVLGGLPKWQSTVGRFTAQAVPNPLDARTTRLMADEVARRATVHFIKDGPFLIPGLEAWSAGFREIRG